MVVEAGALSQADFYTNLEIETRIVVQQRTGEIKSLMRRTAQDIIDIGQKLIEVKDRLGHGRFDAWLDIEFEWSLQTAKRFMNVAQQFQNQQIVDFDMAPSALYLLAAPSVPESAREEALQRAQEGEKIAHHVAQKIVAVHKDGCTAASSRPEARETHSGDEGSRTSVRRHPPDLPEIHTAVTLLEDGSRISPSTALTANAMIETAGQKMAVHFSSRTVEHYTPQNIITPTLACLGEIDLDPCSDGGDPPNVPARMHYTAADNGLAHPWHGRIYMNPPYGREIGDWVEKLCSEHEAGRVTEAVALLPSRTDTQWWRRLREYPICFVQGRLTFVGSQDPAPFPSAVFYLGQDIARFCHSFDHLGDIYDRVRFKE